MDDDQLRFVIYDKSNAFQRDFIRDGNADLNANAISVADFILDDDDPALPSVTADGTRCGVWFRGAERFRGPITATPGEGPTGQVTAHVESDMRKMWHWTCWPVPTAALSAQTVEYRSISGKSEYVFKTFLQENIARLGVSWSVAADHGWGTSVRGTMRFHYPGDRLLPLLDADHLLVVLSYDVEGNTVVDVRQAATVPGVFTVDTGIPDQYKFNRTSPTATRAIVGGRGEGVDREFKQVIDAARETHWDDVIETFVDARSNDEGADITPDAQAAVDEGAPQASVSTDLVETKRFQFGTTYQLGDLLNVRLGPVDTTEQITQVSITCDSDQGTVVTPHIGGPDTDDTDVQLATQVARLAQGLRDQGRR
nr:hypothetical protein [Microbacterium bovistercoris]